MPQEQERCSARFDGGRHFFSVPAGLTRERGSWGNELMAWAGQNPKSYDDVKVGITRLSAVLQRRTPLDAHVCSNEHWNNGTIGYRTQNTRIWDWRVNAASILHCPPDSCFKNISFWVGHVYCQSERDAYYVTLTSDYLNQYELFPLIKKCERRRSAQKSSFLSQAVRLELKSFSSLPTLYICTNSPSQKSSSQLTTLRSIAYREDLM